MGKFCQVGIVNPWFILKFHAFLQRFYFLISMANLIRSLIHTKMPKIKFISICTKIRL